MRISDWSSDVCSSDLRLFIQLSIGLFEFGLLNFQSRLRLLKRTALAFQLLIGCSQLFALRLKLFGLLLGFLKQFLQAYPIFRRSDSNADRFGHAFQKLGMRIVDAFGITQFQICVMPTASPMRMPSSWTRSEKKTSELPPPIR